MRNDKQEQAIRSSAAEYLTFVAATGDSTESMEMRYEDENIWLTQKMMSALYDVDVRTINEHIQKIYEDGELTEEATIRNFRIVQTEGSRQVSRQVKHYNLQMIIAVGFKVNNDRAVQFRKWANTIVKDYTIQGWAMDSDRLKNGGSVLTKEYFDHLLEQIREIRMSERKFYQKITDIYATALDYDKSAKTTRLFFSEVQNKLHWAIHRHTAAELIVERANAEKPHMGLTSWEQYPNGKIQKYDVSIAKNYLSREELQALERIVTMYLDYAEYQAGRHIPTRQKVLSTSERITTLTAELNDGNSKIEEMKAEFNRIVSWSKIFDESPMEVKKMICGYIIKKVSVFRDYRIKIEFNINVEQFLNGIDSIDECATYELPMAQ